LQTVAGKGEEDIVAAMRRSLGDALQ